MIGTILSNESAFPRVAATLNPRDFWNASHVAIYTVMVEMKTRSIPVSMLTVREELARKGDRRFERIVDELQGLVAAVVDLPQLDHFVVIVKDYAVRREIMRVGNEMQYAAAAGADSASVIVSKCYDELFRQLAVSTSGLKSIDKVMRPVMNEVEERSKATDHFRGLRTGFDSLDAVLQGYQPEQVYLFGAYSSVGKTAFALNTVRAGLEAHPDLQVIYYSLEMSDFALGARLLAIETGIPLTKIRSGFLTEDGAEWEEVARASSVLAGYRKQMMINTRRVSIDHIAAECRAMASNHPAMKRLVVVDYIQLVRAKEKERPDLTLRGIARDLLDLSKELYCPVIVFAQLNGDEMERPPDFRPWRRDLRDAKALADDARAVILMSRPWVHRKKDPAYRQCFVRLIIDKHSEGDASEDVDLHFVGEKQIVKEEECPMDCATHLEGTPFPTKGYRKKVKKSQTDVQRALAIAGFEAEEKA